MCGNKFSGTGEGKGEETGKILRTLFGFGPIVTKE